MDRKALVKFINFFSEDVLYQNSIKVTVRNTSMNPSFFGKNIFQMMKRKLQYDLLFNKFTKVEQ